MGSYRSYSNLFAAPGALVGDVARAVFFDGVVKFGWEGGGERVGDIWREGRGGDRCFGWGV